MSIASAIANDKLAELRKKKTIAIQALNFDAAEEFDRQIKETNDQIVTDRIAKIETEILRDLHDQLDKLSLFHTDIDEYKHKQETQLNATYQELFDKAQVQHEKELRNIDRSHAISLLREAEREVPEQTDLLERAKAAAVAGNYTDARSLREEARNVGEAELEARKQRIDQEFGQSRSLLAAKQQEAIEKITEKYDEEIGDLASDVQLRTMEAQQRFEAAVALIRQRAEIRCNALIAEDEVKEDALFNVNQKINEVLRNSQQSGSKPPRRPETVQSPARGSTSTSSISSKRSGRKVASSLSRIMAGSSYSSTTSSGRVSRNAVSRSGNGI
jgi:hypothetical protein